jgi:hypothetical protein
VWRGRATASAGSCCLDHWHVKPSANDMCTHCTHVNPRRHMSQPRHKAKPALTPPFQTGSGFKLQRVVRTQRPAIPSHLFQISSQTVFW